MRSIIALIIFVAFFSSATALSCFFCIGSTESDCARGVVPSMLVQNCDDSLGLSTVPVTLNDLVRRRDDVPIVTTCVTFTATDGEVVGFERGCGFIWENEDLCTYLGSIADIPSCSTCDTDLCNGDPFE